MREKIVILFIFIFLWTSICFSESRIPDVEKVILENGIMLLILESPYPDVVSIYGKIPAGSVFEEDKKGISSAVAYLLLFGTQSMSFDEISEALDEIGARINFSSSRETIDFTAKCRGKDFERVGEILFDAIKRPSFPDEYLSLFKNIQKTRILQMEDDPAYVARSRFYNLSYPESHPFHTPDPEKMISIIESYTREDLLEFHRKYFAPCGMIISVVGNIKKDNVIKKISEWTENFLCQKEIGIPYFETIPSEYLPKSEDIKMKDKTQTYVLVGHPAKLTREDPDFYAMRVANHILADAPLTSRLYQKLREEKGFVYFVDGEFEAGKVAGPYVFTFGCSPEDKIEAIELLKSEIRKIQKEGITEEELQNAVSYIVGSFVLRLETNEGMAQVLTICEYFDLEWDYPWKISRYYNNLTIFEINRVLKKYIMPDKFTIITAGP